MGVSILHSFMPPITEVMAIKDNSAKEPTETSSGFFCLFYTSGVNNFKPCVVMWSKCPRSPVCCGQLFAPRYMGYSFIVNVCNKFSN